LFAAARRRTLRAGSHYAIIRFFFVMAGLSFSSWPGSLFRHGRGLFFVMAGVSFSSWPGLTRPSVKARAAIDGRVKPGHDA
jgi:hypothetical protein